jgi:hypothetical protein
MGAFDFSLRTDEGDLQVSCGRFSGCILLLLMSLFFTGKKKKKKNDDEHLR